MYRKYTILSLTAALLCGCAAPQDDEQPQKCEYAGKTAWCPADKLCCLGECIDHTDENCGACGKACNENAYCGTYNNTMTCLCKGLPCAGTCCEDGCVQLSFNLQNCGICGNACGDNQFCEQGLCKCSAGLQTCEGESACIDTKSNAKHCGACGKACPDAGDTRFHLQSSLCSNGSCIGICASGYQDADNDLISNGCEAQIPTSTTKCGNNIAEPGEICDGKDIRNGTCEEVRGQGSSDTPGCSPDCSALTAGNCSAPIITGVGECASDNDCSGTKPACDTAAKTCVPCTADKHCSGTKPACDTTAQTCVSCTADKHCSGTKPACDTTAKTCVQCTTDAQCSGNKPACDTAAKTCVQCLSDAHCTGETPACNMSAKLCVQCTADKYCASGSCDTSTYSCNTLPTEYELIETVSTFLSPTTDTNPGYYGTFSVKSLTDGGALNIGYWPMTKEDEPDFSTKYIRYDFKSIASKLKGKTHIAVTFNFNKNSSGPARMAIAFFNGNTRLNTPCIEDVTTTMKETHRCEAKFISTEDLQMRIIGDSSPKDNAGTLRFAPDLKIWAK
ncbi:MAG: hypothetical protein IKY83_03645 [Proteobacteria bacterium]|nr:hypothetical protein [Pseudomonadota bacterium]